MAAVRPAFAQQVEVRPRLRPEPRSLHAQLVREAAARRDGMHGKLVRFGLLVAEDGAEDGAA